MPFLRNSWYCASWSSDLKDRPVGIKILNEDIVLFRKNDGAVAALSGICPHRFALLGRGQVVGNNIECPYHGLQFNGLGQCAHNPHGSAIPSAAKLRVYPLVEKFGACWIWMGDPSAATPETIPSFDFVSNRHKWAGLTGCWRVEANYQIVLDNLLDLTHAAYIHRATVGVNRDNFVGETKMDYEFSMKDGVVHSDYVFRNTPLTPFVALFADMPVGDIHTPMALYPASTLILDMGVSKPGQPKSEGVLFPSAHFIVPETETTSHYFFATFRNAKLNDDKITEAMGAMSRHAFLEEDAPIIRDVQKVMGDAELFSMRPVLLRGDIAAVQARRLLAQLIQKENAGALKAGELEGAVRASDEVARVL
jgi:vanillate O-demethylase monooxygenase subunit